MSAASGSAPGAGVDELRTLMLGAVDRARLLGHELGWFRPMGNPGEGCVAECGSCGRKAFVTLDLRVDRVSGPALEEACDDGRLPNPDSLS